MNGKTISGRLIIGLYRLIQTYGLLVLGWCIVFLANAQPDDQAPKPEQPYVAPDSALLTTLTPRVSFVKRLTSFTWRDSSRSPIVRSFLKSWFVIPFVSYAPETRLVIGINIRGLYKTSRSDSTLRSSYASLVLDATQNRQVIILGKTENLLPGERWRIVGLGGYLKYPITYWGVGPRTADSAASSIEYQSVRLEASVQRRFSGKWFLGGGYKLTRFWDVQNAPDGTLFTEQPLGWQGVWASGPSLNLVHDSRSNLFGAYRGWYLDVTASYAEPGLGSTYRFGHLLTDFRYYLPVRGINKDVLAFNVYCETTAGDLPVWHMPAAGGSRLLRGYFRGRYIDRNYVVAQVEYRWSVFKYLGLVGFLASGAVGPVLGELPQSPLLLAGGGGLRVKINPKENAALRLDVAYGNALQFYLGVFEAF